MALSAKLQQVNNWSVWCDITDHSHQTQLKQCLVTAHWPTGSKNPISAVDNVLSPGTHARTHVRTHARTHARTHTHTYSGIYIYYYTVGLNIMYRPTLKNKTLHWRKPRWDPVFILGTPFFSNQWGPRTMFFMP